MHLERIVVIGSNSFSGATLVRLLLEKGHEVIGLSRSPEYDDVFLPYKWLEGELDKFQFEQVDLNHDLEKIIKIINKKEKC